MTQASCVDVQHKKRGRPRLREEDNLREAAFANDYVRAEDYSSRGGIITVPQPGRPKSKSYRELRSQPGALGDQRPRTSDPLYSNGHYLQIQPVSHAPLFISASVPTVLLTPDLVVAQHNHAFAQALALTFNARGHGLIDLVVPSEREKLARLQNSLRAEMLNATRLPPINGRFDSWASMPAIENLDIGRATAGFQTRSEYWTFRLSKDQSRGFPISISLAEAGAHFVVLTLIQRPDSSQSVLSPGLTEAIRNHHLSSPPTQTAPLPVQERHPSKSTQQQRTHSRTYSYGDHLPMMSPTGSHPLELQPSHSLSVSQYSQRSPPKQSALPALPYVGSKQSSSPEQLRIQGAAKKSRASQRICSFHQSGPPVQAFMSRGAMITGTADLLAKGVRSKAVPRVEGRRRGSELISKKCFANAGRRLRLALSDLLEAYTQHFLRKNQPHRQSLSKTYDRALQHNHSSQI